MANKKVSQLVSKPSVLVTDLFPIADPTTGQLFKTTISDLGTAIGSGVSSVNGLVGAVVLDTDDIQELASPTNRWFTDTRARAALSAASPLAYNSGTGVFSLPQANGSTNGFLSSADWTTFNAKQAALSGTGFVKISGTTISYDNSTYLTTSAAASTYLALSGGTLTGALNGTSATFSGDVTLSATNPRLYFTDTDNNPDYFISNTDGTFTIYDVTNSTSRLTISTLNTILNTNLRVDGDVLIKQDSVLGGVSGYTAIASDTDGIFLKLGTASAHAYLVLSSLTSFRNFTFPDATGTIALTSNLSSYLPLTGGTLTGGLSGTTGSFSGNVSTSAQLRIEPSGNAILVIGSRSSGTPFEIYNTSNILRIYNGSIDALQIATGSGAATFSSSVTANKYILNGTNGNSGQIIQQGDLLGTVATNFLIQSSAGNGLGFLVNGGTTFNMFITSSGNVGIGTTSPSNLLHVAGVGRIDTGLYFNNSGTNGAFVWQIANESLRFGTNDTERMRITSGGLVAIGGTGAGEKLNITSGNQKFYTYQNSAGQYTYIGTEYAQGNGNNKAEIRFGIESDTYTNLSFHTANGFGTLGERMRISSGGTVNIGQSPFNLGSLVATSGLHTIDTKYQFLEMSMSSNVARFRADWLSGAGGSSPDMSFWTGGSERMRINSSGTVCVRRTTSLGTNYSMAVQENIAMYVNANGNNMVNFFNASETYVSSIVINASSVAYNTSSDYRLKTDLKAFSGLDIVSKINVYDFAWKSDNSRTYGVIAHELQEVLPNAVSGIKDALDENGNIKNQGVDYSKIVPVMVQAIKDLKAELDTLKNK